MVVYTFNKHSSRGRLNSVSSGKFDLYNKFKDSQGYLSQKQRKEKYYYYQRNMDIVCIYILNGPIIFQGLRWKAMVSCPVLSQSDSSQPLRTISFQNRAASLWHLHFGFLVLFCRVLISYSSLDQFYSQTCYPLATQRFLFIGIRLILLFIL